jgi:transcriptional regulator with XRE-family HTH domain
MPRPNPRDPETDLAAALGEELKRLRLAAGYTTQEAFARAINFTREAVSKVETGYELPSDNLYLKWLGVCQASDETRHHLDRMLRMARKAKAATPEFAKPWLDAEQAADIIRIWALDVMPGLFQTYDHAFAMYRIGGMDEETAAAKATARIERKQILDGTHVTAIIYEPILNRVVGTREIMAGELEHLLEVMEKPNAVIQVVRDTGYFVGLDGQFEIASGSRIPDTLNMITVEDHTTDDEAVVRRAATMFEIIRGFALSVGESRALLQEALQRWKSQE